MNRLFGLIFLVVSLSLGAATQKTTVPTFCPTSQGQDYRLCTIDYTLAGKEQQQFLFADGGSGEFQVLTGDTRIISELIERHESGNMRVLIRNKSNDSVTGVLEVEIH